MAKFRKKPVVIEAKRLTWQNRTLLPEWMGTDVVVPDNETHVLIATLEGTMKAEIGDWIIEGVAGEFYPCKNEIFEATYEAVDD